MNDEAGAKSVQFHARTAGFLYLSAMAAYVAPLVVLGGLDVPGDFARTAQNIAASETQVRLALTGLLVGFVAILGLAWALYVVLRRVDPRLALLALLCRAVEAALMAVSTLIWFAALGNYLAPGELAVRQLLDRLLTAGINTAFHFAMICSSVGSILFFWLLYRSRGIPRPLAGFDLLASALALAFAFALLLAPDSVARFGLAGWGPIFLAEIATGLWLLAVGVRPGERA
ncbi:MAG TPA: DUF4386 domain-containing protein [Allosphingosinicella sp.]|nr:DUF4386 domain-containing protein [Allosphingosinicella sp.]